MECGAPSSGLVLHVHGVDGVEQALWLLWAELGLDSTFVLAGICPNLSLLRGTWCLGLFLMLSSMLSDPLEVTVGHDDLMVRFHHELSHACPGTNPNHAR